MIDPRLAQATHMVATAHTQASGACDGAWLILTGPACGAKDLVSWGIGKVGDAAAGVATDAWTAAMMAIWDAGLWFLRLMLSLVNFFLTPDIDPAGPAGRAYGYAFWLAGALAVLFILVQLGISAVQFQARGLGRALVGTAKFLMVITLWVFYAGLIIAACSGLATALTQGLLGSSSLTASSLWKPFSAQSAPDAATATVLAFMGIFLILSSLAVVFVYIARAAALIILVATAPIAAAGLVVEFGSAWFWKTFRWFHAAALTPVLMVLVLGIGADMASGVASGLAGSMHSAIADAVPACAVMVMAGVCPLAMFKMLSFVEPGTPSGAALRQGLAAQGGIRGLVAGGAGAGGEAAGEAPGLSAATQSGQHGGSHGEDQAQNATGGRFAKVLGAAMPALGAVGAGMSFANSLGTRAVAMQADLDAQAGVGHQSHYPDWSGINPRQQTFTGSGGQANNGDDDQPSPPGRETPTSAPFMPPSTTPPGTPSTGAGAAGAAEGLGPEAAAAAL